MNEDSDKIIVAKAEDRFNKILFEIIKDKLDPDELPVYAEERFYPAIYTCPNCHGKVSITRKDLEKHFNNKFSNLKESENKEIEKFIGMEPDPDFSFLDFYCPDCKLKVKVYYECWLGGIGLPAFQLKYVIEAK
jgi:hypothetical protein